MTEETKISLLWDVFRYYLDKLDLEIVDFLLGKLDGKYTVNEINTALLITQNFKIALKNWNKAKNLLDKMLVNDTDN